MNLEVILSSHKKQDASHSADQCCYMCMFAYGYAQILKKEGLFPSSSSVQLNTPRMQCLSTSDDVCSVHTPAV